MKNIILLSLFMIMIGVMGYFFAKESSYPHPIGHTVNNIKVKPHKNKEKQKLQLPQLLNKMPHIEELDEITQQVIGMNPDLSLRSRNKLVWQLRNRDLTQKDFEALFIFLKQNPNSPGNHLFWHSLKNDLLVIIINDGRYKESVALLMNEIINDDQQHPVMREYTLQYVTDFFERHWINKLTSKEISNYSKVDELQQKKLLATMYRSLKWPDGAIAGTALIKLHELSQQFPIVNKEKLNQETKRMIYDNFTSESSKMAALSIAADRRLKNCSEEIERISFDQSESTIIRMSAVNALAKLSKDEYIIERIKTEILSNKNSDDRLINAAQMTLNKQLK